MSPIAWVELGSLCVGEYLISAGNSSASLDRGCSARRIQSQSISHWALVGWLGPVVCCFFFRLPPLCRAVVWLAPLCLLGLLVRTSSTHTIKPGRDASLGGPTKQMCVTPAFPSLPLCCSQLLETQGGISWNSSSVAAGADAETKRSGGGCLGSSGEGVPGETSGYVVPKLAATPQPVLLSVSALLIKVFLL